MSEKYYKWEPVEGIEPEMWVEALNDDYEGLRILLKGNISQAVLKITFKQYYLYRNVDESYRIKLWTEGSFDERKWALYKTSGSNLIDWLYEESDGVYEKDKMVHYLVKTGADVVEVVTNQTLPTVEWLNGQSTEQPNGTVLVKKGKRGNYYDKF